MKQLQVALLIVSCLSAILFSQTTWTSRTSGTTNGLFAIIYANNQYVVTGDRETILTSPNGITWTRRNVPHDPLQHDTLDVSSIAYGNNHYVALLNANGELLTSSDGITWVTKTFSTPDTLHGVAYGNNMFVVTGTSGGIFTSPDGITWTSRVSGTTNGLGTVSYSNNQFITFGGAFVGGVLTSASIYTSSDGITWSSRAVSTAFPVYRLIYANNQYVGTCYYMNKIVTSSDCITYSARTLSTPQSPWDVTYYNNQYVVVGDSGSISTSADCITWTSRTTGTTNMLHSVIYGNSQYVAVGVGGTILTSPITNAISYTLPKLSYSVLGKTMQIYTLQGTLIAQKQIESENYLDSKNSMFQDLSKGMYLVRIPTGSAVISRRVLVE